MSLLLLDGADGQPAGRVAADYAAMLAQLLPRGKLWRYTQGILASVLLGSADELARVDQRVIDLLDEAYPSTAVELLPDYERELGLLPSAPTTAERQANIVGRLVNRQRFRPTDIQLALAPLLVQDPADVVVLERTPTFCAAVGDQREIFRFFAYRDPGLPGAAFIASAQALLDEMKPSRTAGYVIESIAFTLGDPHSLLGRDILGA